MMASTNAIEDERDNPQSGSSRINAAGFPQSLTADGMRLHREQSTLVIVEQQSLHSELFKQCFDLSVLELNDLLLTLVHEAAEGSQQGVPWLEGAEHVRRRKSVSVRCRPMKSSG